MDFMENPVNILILNSHFETTLTLFAAWHQTFEVASHSVALSWTPKNSGNCSHRTGQKIKGTPDAGEEGILSQNKLLALWATGSTSGTSPELCEPGIHGSWALLSLTGLDKPGLTALVCSWVRLQGLCLSLCLFQVQQGGFDLWSLNNLLPSEIGWGGRGLFQQLWDKVLPPSGAWENFALFLGMKNQQGTASGSPLCSSNSRWK